MDENKTVVNNDEVELDLSILYKLIKKNIKLIILSTLIMACLVLLFTVLFVEKKYASTTRIYLTPKVTDQGIVDNTTVNSNSILVKNYVSILKGENILGKVADDLNISSVDDVKKSLTIDNETDTQIIAVTAKTKDPVESKDIASTTVKVFFSEMKDKLDIRNMTILDNAKVNPVPVSPNKKMSALIGAAVGLILSLGYVFLRFILDKRLRNRDEAENFLGIPTLAEIPYYVDK